MPEFNGESMEVYDLGDALVVLPSGTGRNLLAEALSADEHHRNVSKLDDPDLATS